jgi:hypothetical protein
MRLDWIAPCPALFFAITLATACGSDEPGDDPGAGGDDGPAEGYVRLRTTPITLQPGESGLWAQWVALPGDADQDIIDVTGWQSPGGHHALLYATMERLAPGETRPWGHADQITARFLGGIGGEGAERVLLPEGAVFRVPAGQGLLIQTHYVNTTDAPIVGESYLDVKLVPADPTRQVASMFSITTLDVAVPPGEHAKADVECVLAEDVELIMYANHMHAYGVSQKTTMTALGEGGDGRTEDVKVDLAWEYEWAFNPNFTVHPVAAPLRLPAGTRLRSECEWANSSSGMLGFPDEMCVFFGFHLGDRDLTCNGGDWL